MTRKLINLQSGQKAKVLSVHGGRAIKSRLQAMGIFPGAYITIIQNMNRGPVIIEIFNTRLAIGRGMAEKVEVETNE